MKQQTAVEWLETAINSILSVSLQPLYVPNVEIPQSLFEQAKKMEKEQIIKVANDADDSDFWVKYESFEQYYNETYSK